MPLFHFSFWLFPAHSLYLSLTISDLLYVMIVYIFYSFIKCEDTGYTPFAWFISLSIIILRFIHLVAGINSWLLFIVEKHFILWKCYNLFIHLPIGEYLNCFQFLVIQNNLNTHVKSLCGHFSWVNTWEYRTTWSASWETCMQVRKQQLELDMEQ